MADKSYERNLVEETIARSRKIMEQTLELASKDVSDQENNTVDFSFPSYFTDGIKSTPFSPTEDSVLGPIENTWQQPKEYTADFPRRIAQPENKSDYKEAEIAKLNRLIVEETATSREQTQEISTLRSKIKKQEALNEAHVSKVSKLKSKVKSYKQDTSSLLKTKQCLVNDISDLQKQILQLKSTHDKEINRLKAHIEIFEKETKKTPESALSDLARAQSQISKLQADYEKQFFQVQKELAEQKQINAEILESKTVDQRRSMRQHSDISRRRPLSVKKNRSCMISTRTTPKPSVKKTRRAQMSTTTIKRSHSVRRTNRRKASQSRR